MSIFTDIVDRTVTSASDDTLMDIIRYAQTKEIEVSEIAYLAKVLANSGNVIISAGKYSDVPSTGGPSSLSTLLCPLMLNTCGFKVVKLGVPGRPAGGIDVLAQIENYRINYSKQEIEEAIKHCDYIHFVADSNFAPMDLRLFEMRKKNQALNLPPLVIASLLSKKIACGLQTTGLDIRVATHGNFGRTFEEARTNAVKLKEVGDFLGMKIHPFLTAGEYAYQPFIGRGESLLALHQIFEAANINSGVKRHLDLCAQITSAIAKADGITFRSSIPLMKKFFISNLEHQGSSYKNFLDAVEKVRQDSFHDIKSLAGGFVSYALSEVRDLIVNNQTDISDNGKVKFSDAIGLTILRDVGEYVRVGDSIATIRMKDFLSSSQKESILERANRLMKVQPFLNVKNYFEIV